MSDSDVKLGSDLSWQLLKERASTFRHSCMEISWGVCFSSIRRQKRRNQEV